MSPSIILVVTFQFADRVNIVAKLWSDKLHLGVTYIQDMKQFVSTILLSTFLELFIVLFDQNIYVLTTPSNNLTQVFAHIQLC